MTIFVGMAIAIFAMTAGYADQPQSVDMQITITNATQKLFPDEELPEPAQSELKIHSARNEYAPYQIAFHLPGTASSQTVHIEVKDLSSKNGVIKSENAKLYLVETVTIEKPSMPYPQRVWPDPLPPYHDFTVQPGETRSAWVDLFIPEETIPGVYGGEAVVTYGDQTRNLKVTVKVASPVIPTTPTLKTAFGISYGDIARAHGVEENTPEYKALMDKYYWFHVEHRVSPYHIPVDFYSEEAHEYLDDPRVTFLRAPFSWDKEEMEKINRRLVDMGWIKKAVFYNVDEPEPGEFEKVAKIGKWLYEINPDLQMLITHGVAPGLQEGMIDIWCPVIMVTMDPMEVKKLKKEVADGKEFWWYTCIGPKWEGTTYFIDEYATAPRIHPWMNFLYGVSGLLYYRTTRWKDVQYDPWEHTETYPGGNGDGSLLYPGSKVGYEGPVASIRLKNIREGIEEFELLKLLRDAIVDAAAEIGGSASDYDPDGRLYEHAFGLITEEGRSNMLGTKTPYMMFETFDYSVIENEKARVIEEIENMGKTPLILVETKPVEYSYTNNDSAMIHGYVEEGATVFVNGTAAAIKGVEFFAKVDLKQGKNSIKITAQKDDGLKTLNITVFKR